MSGEVGLDEALGLLAGSLTDRKKGLEDLTRILRVNQRNANATTLADETYQTMYQALFALVRTDRSTWLSAKTSTTQSTTADRLSNLAIAVRLAVELGIRSVSSSTITSIIAHVLDTVTLPRGGLCTPLALEYIRCLRVIASRQNHVEHLSSTDWSAVAQFCIDASTDDPDLEDARGGAEQRLSPAPALRLSHRSSRSGTTSRSQLKDSSTSQELRNTIRQVSDEAIATLALLSAVPNGPLPKMAPAIMKSMVDFLKANSTSRVGHHDAFATINHILKWSTTDDIALTKSNTTQLMRLIQHFWSLRTSGLRDEMLITLIYLQPYMVNLASHDQAPTIRKELRGLFETLRSDYTKRDQKDRLRLDHLRLALPSFKNECRPALAHICFGLHSPGMVPEHCWALISILATVTALLELQANGSDSLDDDQGESDPEDGYEIHATPRRPRKRQRLSTKRDEILAGVKSGSGPLRICSLQVLAFVAQQQAMTKHQLVIVLDRIIEACNDTSPEIVSWALMALCGCAMQQIAEARDYKSKWEAIWLVACRTLSDADCCRAACQLLCVLIHRHMISQSSVAELIQAIASSIDTSGPSTVADSASWLLCTLLQSSQHLGAGLSSALRESILYWLSRRYASSYFDDKTHCSVHFRSQPQDIVYLIRACLGESIHPLAGNGVFCWNRLGQAWAAYQAQKELVAYLLLNTSEQGLWLSDLACGHVYKPNTSLAEAVELQSLYLTRSLADLQKTQELWLEWRNERIRGIGSDRMVYLYKAICANVFVVIDSTFQDQRRQSQIQRMLEKMLTHIAAFLSSSDCTQEIFDSVITSATCHLPGLADYSSQSPVEISQAQRTLCRHLSDAIEGRKRHQGSYGQGHDDMDLDDEFESQHSTHAGSLAKSSEEFLTDSEITYSVVALRANAGICAFAVSSMTRAEGDVVIYNDGSSRTIVDYLKSTSATDLIASRAALAAISRQRIALGAAEAYTLLEDFADRVLGTEFFDRSEPALVTVLGTMSGLLPTLVQADDKDLFELGLDVYNYFVEAIEKGALSIEVQRCFGAYLLQLCNLDAEYGSKGAIQSARTSLFKLVHKASMKVQFFLAKNISSIFGHYVLSAHNQIFDDLQRKLTDESACIEGLAIRLLYLSRLGSAWHTLLRQCVYYISETAGLVKMAGSHAARCVTEMTTSLGFEDARRLFRLFASQLLYTWLGDDQRTLNSLPYSAFQYSSLEALLKDNECEITAQLIMRGKEDGLQIMTKCIGVSPKDLALRSFAKSAAYSIAWDISNTSPGADKNAVSEGRLRTLIGGRQEAFSIMAEQFPVIVGTFYASMQQEDFEDQWLEKRNGYGTAAQALARIKSYSYSARALPPSQQPCFRSKFVPDQIERLCRRTGHDPMQPWDTSSFSLAARMLIDSIDHALGPLHTSQVLRKLRILISLAGNVACSGYPLQMLLHSIRPFLSEGHCADDALGILKYLLEQGQSYLRSEDPSLMHGFICVVILQMRAHSTTRQDSTTQETQHLETVQRMEAFQVWLVQYVSQSSGQSDADTDRALFVENLETVRLPGTARKDTAESALLLLLLRQLSRKKPLMARSRCIEALSLLTTDFETPTLTQEDCLMRGDLCAQYVDSLWLLLSLSKPSASFMAWSGGVLGRAYAYNGIQAVSRSKDDESLTPVQNTQQDPTASSKAAIVQRLADLLLASNRAEAGLVDWTLRTISYGLESEAARLVFEKMLPKSLVPALDNGTYGYVPHMSSGCHSSQSAKSELRHAMQAARAASNRDWSSHLALALCSLASHVPLLAPLRALLGSIEGLAEELLPNIVHLVLADEIDKEQLLRDELSSMLARQLVQLDEASRPKQRLLIRLLLYLRSQPWPGEATKADRIQWLRVDLMNAASAASRCGLPNAALLLAESIPPTANPSKRSSGRTSFSPLLPAGIPDELLLSIFKQTEEPDSYYGVQQAASLDSVIERLDYESKGLSSLMYRSAQMDGAMRSAHKTSANDSMIMMHSLSAMQLHGLKYTLLAGPLACMASSTTEMLDTARKLQQWDRPVPQDDGLPAAVRFLAFQELSRAADRAQASSRVTTLLSNHIRVQLNLSSKLPSTGWYDALTSTTIILDVIRSSGEQALKLQCGLNDEAQYHVSDSHKQGVSELADDRATLLNVLSRNTALLRDMHVNPKAARLLEARALLNVAELARKSDNLQEALSASTQITLLSRSQRESGLKISAAVALESSCVLWETGEFEASVKMLKDAVNKGDSEGQDLPVGESGMLAMIADRLADARLERPDDILQSYLKPAIDHLKSHTEGREAGNVFYAFATFCDQQLQNPNNIEEFNRISRMRQKKLRDLNDLEAITKNSRKSSKELKEAEQAERKARTWYEMDDEEYRKLSESRDGYIHQSLQNYLLCLHASNEHDISLLRFFAMWLENCESSQANNVVAKCLDMVPSWKFVVLNNQLMSRLASEKTPFQTALAKLITRIGMDHPYHIVHHIFAATRKPQHEDDNAAMSRCRAAQMIRGRLERDTPAGPLITKIFNANRECMALAKASVDQINSSKIAVKDFPAVNRYVNRITSFKVPPTIVSIPLRSDRKYDDVPLVAGMRQVMGISGGLSRPKSLEHYGTDGKIYKQLFKNSPNDDVRQDAIMEQIFEEASKMLRNHKATRQRDLHVRAYKVIPLESHCAVVEWVLNTKPIGDFLKPAHQTYYPQSMRSDEASQRIRKAAKDSEETRLHLFRNICAQIPPVLRHFFFELFDDPDEWFKKRTAYTRTTAVISILGWVLGLGDRHCQNILLDEQTGEAVHIDLGVAFEAGRVLPIPEKVPFRLTRDIIDAMGVTKTEGVFRRCCEFTLEALREDKSSIMTLLNVLRYDPLVNWTVSPLRAKRMQEAIEMSKDGAGNDENSSKSREEEGGEAERALTVVEKKLSKTLSTSATVNELIQQATDEKNLATLFAGWSAYF